MIYQGKSNKLRLLFVLSDSLYMDKSREAVVFYNVKIGKETFVLVTKIIIYSNGVFKKEKVLSHCH